MTEFADAIFAIDLSNTLIDNVPISKYTGVPNLPVPDIVSVAELDISGTALDENVLPPTRITPLETLSDTFPEM